MRSTAAIICAVKERQDVTVEELRLALLVLNSTEYFLKGKLLRLIDAANKGKDFLIELARGDADTVVRETLFNLHKADPEVCLGPDNLPGSPIHDARYAAGLRLIDKLLAKDRSPKAMPRVPTFVHLFNPDVSELLDFVGIVVVCVLPKGGAELPVFVLGSYNPKDGLWRSMEGGSLSDYGQVLGWMPTISPAVDPTLP